MILYGQDKKQRIKLWQIEIEREGDKIYLVTTFGYKNHKMQTIKKQVKCGKNVGKANETSLDQQAKLQLNSCVQSKLDEGYVENEADLTAKNDLCPFPMLAQDFAKHSSKIKFPCMVQKKYDGIRCIFFKGKFFSRNRKEFVNLHHLYFDSDLVFDGELYNHDLTFQELISIVKDEKCTDKTKVKFVVYDVIMFEFTFEERFEILKNFVFDNDYIQVAPTSNCLDKFEIDACLDAFIQEGYEGAIVRNMQGKYSCNRSFDLQKYKKFLTDEFEIVGFKCGEGLEQDCIIWVCKAKNGNKFFVRPVGSREERMEQFKSGNKSVGKMLTVKYQELTNDGTPRFPVGIVVRDFE